MKIHEVTQRLDAKCWKGKHKEGTKIKGNKRVNNCVPNESSINEVIDSIQVAPIGINVKTDKKAKRSYADLIIDGEKAYESRKGKSLMPFVGKTVSIIRTGNGMAKAIGCVTVGSPIIVDETQFRELEDKHLVPAGSAFDIVPGETKYLYPMLNPHRYDKEYDVSNEGSIFVSRKVIIDRDEQEVINEAISGSHWIHALHNGLTDIGEQQSDFKFDTGTHDRGAGGHNVPYFKVSTLHPMHGLMQLFFIDKLANISDVRKEMEQFVHGIYLFVILANYAKVCSSAAGVNVSRISLADKSEFKGAGASAGYDYITFYVDLDKMLSRDVENLMSLMYDYEVFDNNDRISDFDSLKSAITELDISNLSLFKFLIETDQIDTVVHELVHIKQHSSQDKNITTKRVFNKDTGKHELISRGTEFRSKLEPNLIKFRNAVKNLSQGPEERKIYSSSLQEIPAHAHSAATKIIRDLDFAWGGSVDEYGDYLEHLQSQLKALKLIITNLSNGPKALQNQYGRPFRNETFEYFSKTFNHPNDKKLYSVYKRFVKVLSQELINYYHYWNKHL